METGKQSIKVETSVKAPIGKVWEYWTGPRHIEKWNNASDDWHTPHAENDLRVGGTFVSKMAAKDGSFAFDYSGTYNAVTEHKYIEYSLADGRKVQITFEPEENETKIVETFDAEETHPVEMQRGGWQAILDNFKKYTETN
jgi:uncharacterized protein YndB with AHSA1/START domain